MTKYLSKQINCIENVVQKLLLSIAFFLCILGTTNAAVSTGYVFSQTSGSYVALSAPTVVFGPFNDDPIPALVTLPFSFTVDGTVFTQIKVNNNGAIYMGPGFTGSTNYSAISSTVVNPSILAPFARDLVSNAAGGVSTQTLGFSPNRQFVIQFADMRNFGGSGQNYNFQVILNETTNVIQFKYGTMLTGVSTTAQVGLRGTTNADFNNRTTAANWAATTAGAANSASMTLSNIVFPTSGLTYTFAPPAVYCTPTAFSGTAFGDYLSLVQLNPGLLINNSTLGAASPYYTLFNTPNPTLNPTGNYSLTVRAGTYPFNDIRAWIDYNQNGTFEATESIGQVYDMGANPTTATFNFTVPGSATAGQTRMRVREADQGGTNMDPCLALSYGETEDYLVQIGGSAPCAGTPAPGNTVASASAVCAGQSLTLSLQNNLSQTGYTYQWQTAPTAGGPWAAPAGAPSCNYIFRLTDSFGDGWNGNTMSVRIGTTVINTFGSTFFTGVGPVDIPVSLNDGTTYNLFWNLGGSFANEVGVQILNSQGVVIYTKLPGTGSQGTILNTFTASCSSNSTGATFTTTQTAATCYRAIVTCTNGGASTISTPICVAQTLCYCASVAGSTFDDEIFNVNIAGLNNTSSCATVAPGPGSLQNRYSNYVGFTTVPNLTQSASYPMSVTAGQCNGFAFSGIVSVFFDFNQDGDFDDANEIAYTSPYQPWQPAGTTVNFNVIIPGCATAGNTRMRVIQVESTVPPTPCGAYTWGETEDYLVNIVSGPVVPAVASAISGTATAVCNTALSYSVAAGYSSTIQWQFATVPGGPYTDIAGATLANQTLFANGPSTFYLRVRFIGIGCTPDAISNELTVVITSPVVNFTTSTPSTSICRGTSVTITASAAGPYVWNTGATTQSITVSPLVNTSYSVTTGTGLCTGAGTIAIDIIGGPIATSAVSPSGAQCPGSPANLTSNLIAGVPGTGYTGASIPYTSVSTAGTAVALFDDQVSGAIPIGFNFTFFGTAYTDAYISSNGFITFTSTFSNGCCTGQNLPSTLDPNNLIALAWEDYNPGGGTAGTITYSTLGSAPNRQFVVSFTGVPHFGGLGGPLTGQIILYETTNVVGLHIQQMTSDGGFHTQGIENVNGTSAFTTPGRNSTNWSATNSGYQFTPNLGQTFTYVGPVTYTWTGTNGFTANTQNATDYPLVPTTYTLVVADDVCSSSTTVTKNVLPDPIVTSSTLTPYCENNSIQFFTEGSGASSAGTPGSLLVNISSSGWTDESTWNIRNAANVIIASGGPYGFAPNVNTTVNPSATDYPITFFAETQGTLGDNTLNYTVTCSIGNTVLTSGSLTPLQSYTSAPYSCNTPTTGLTYVWTGPNGFSSTLEDPSISPATLADNGTYTVTITDGNGCTKAYSTDIVVNANPVMSLSVTPVTCDGFNDGSVQITVNGGDQNLFYFISDEIGNFGFDNPQIFGGYYDGTYPYLVQDGNNCFTNDTLVITTVPNIAPVITGPASMTMFNDAGICGAAVTYVTPVGTDVCPIIGTVQTNGLPTGSTFPIGTTVNTFVVTDVFGLTASHSFSVTVTDNEAPTTSNVPSNFSACNPVSWTVPTIADNCPGALQIVASHLPGTVFPPGTTTVTYTATDVYNNTATASFDVTVLPASIEADSITTNREYNNICLGENITLSINGGVLGFQGQWKWYRGGCGTGSGGILVASNVTSITVAPTTTTTYYARAEGFCNNTICKQMNVVVSATPASGAVTYNTLPVFGAPGVTDSIKVNPVPGATFYRWSTNNGQINGVLFNGQVGPVQTTIPKVNITFVLPQSNYQIRVLAGNACGRTNQANATIRGTVPAPTSLTGPTLVCPSQTSSYTVSAVPAAGSYIWALNPPNAGSISGTGLTRSVTFATGFTSALLCVNGVSNFGLSGPTYCISISSSAPAPVAISGNGTPCQGSTGTYTTAAIAGAVSYLWTTSVVGATISGTGTAATVVFPSAAFTGIICVRSVSACGTSASACMNVTSGAPGVPGAITGPVQGICNASNVNYAIAASPGAIAYNWVMPANASISSGGTSNSVNVNFLPGFTSGIITVNVTYPCGTGASTISVTGAPSTPTVSPSSICPGGDDIYFASSTGANSFNWTITGQDYAECTNPPSCSQYYIIWGATGGTLSVTAANGCGTSAALNVTNSPIASLSSPTYNCGFNITCNGLSNGSINTSALGGCQPYTYLWSNGQTTASLSGLAAGTYTLTVTDNNGNSTVQSITLNQPTPLTTSLGADQSFEFACTCADLVAVSSGGSACQTYTYAWNTGAASSMLSVCPGQTTNYTVIVTDNNGCTASDVVSIIKPGLVAQLDRYVLMGLGTSDDDIGNSTVVYGAVGHRGTQGKIKVNNYSQVSDWMAGNHVEIGNNNTIGGLYRNLASVGSGNSIGTTTTPVSIPLTSQVPCFPIYSGGTNITVASNALVTLSPGTYNLVTLGNGSTLRLNPGVYRFGKLQTGNDSFILPVATYDAHDVFIFVKEEAQFGNANSVRANIYAKKEMQFSNVSYGSYYGAFMSGMKFQTGNNASYYLDAYCYSNLPLCVNREAAPTEQGIASLTEVLNLYPNPSNGAITIQYSGKTGQTLKFSVVNLLGQVVYERNVYEFLGVMEQQIDLNHLNAGVYYLQLQNGDQRTNKQFVISR